MKKNYRVFGYNLWKKVPVREKSTQFFWQSYEEKVAFMKKKVTSFLTKLWKKSSIYEKKYRVFDIVMEKK